jgi:hypothetical protein
MKGAASSTVMAVIDSAMADMRTAKIFCARVGEERIRSRSERA